VTTWLKKLRLYLLRRQLKAVNRRLVAFNETPYTHQVQAICDFRADLINRIAEIEKTL
jgi:hypothetical protein